MKKERSFLYSVHDKDCYGCKKHNKHIMISYLSENKDFIDIFLSQLEAKDLVRELQKRIDMNEDETEYPVSRCVMIEKTIIPELVFFNHGKKINGKRIL